ncbi:hypothetical protein ALC62_07286 [Cyphomyrmex costatus]|uniref:Glycoprotein n=1 Tax=Cyphomyrmex costatus TaxID=456900 RepID=A0A151IHU5_9HYME|nr:hypothetical protein ALC62_07286 [Cyphomyrmex costatus]
MAPIFLLSLVIQVTEVLLGYDCGGSSFNSTTISLLDVGECHAPNDKPNTTAVYLQLLQTAEYAETLVHTCRIEIDRHIMYCGMHSHVSLVQGSHRKYLVDIDQTTCHKIHATRSFSYGQSTPIVDLHPNSTNYRSLTLAGSIAIDETCHGVQYSDPYGTWNNVIVEASIYITYKGYRTTTKSSQDLIILRSGTHCKILDLTCIDEDGANVFWSPLPDNSCKFHSYDELYQGTATKIIDSNSRYPVVYFLTSEDTTFALSKKSERVICGFTLIQTEHPKLIIVETTRDNPFATKHRILTNNLDTFTYINSKFIYVEKHIKNQVQALYQNMIYQKCQLEQQVIRNALSLAHIRPDLFAHHLMKGSGYMALIAGEVAHLMKCIPIEVIRRSTQNCYLELPVTFNNQSVFLTPKTRVITKAGTIVDCNPLMPVMYSMQGGWISLTPLPAAVTPPQILEPLSQPEWHYTDTEYLASSGIYSESDLARLREHIMFPVEQPTMMKNFAKAAAGYRVPLDGLSINNLLDEDALNRIAGTTAERLWGGFLKFGTATAGFIGVWLIIKGIKIVADTVIHGYALHSVYGWSVHLLGAIFASVTSLLMHLGGKKQRPPPVTHRAQSTDTMYRSNASIQTADCPTIIPRTQATRSTTQAKQNPELYPTQQMELAVINESLSNLEKRLNQCVA